MSKAPSLLRQIIRINYEAALQNRAMRIMKKQKWSVEFLTEMMKKVSDQESPMELVLVSPSGEQLIIRPRNDEMAQFDDDILNHLDDEAAVRSFIAKNGR